MPDAARSTSTLRRTPDVDDTDWLKAAAILLVSAGHFGQFFMEDDRWWSAFGCPAAPIFFFLMGYARTRKVPLRWIWLGVVLTLLDSWNAGWTWQAPNILLSFVLIRTALPRAGAFLQRRGWGGFVLIAAALLAALPVAGEVVDYGAEGWLWALFGLCQRMHADRGRTAGAGGAVPGTPAPARTVDTGRRRLLACLLAAAVFIWQEQMKYGFLQIQLAALILGVGITAAVLCLFRRGPSRIQPPEPLAGALRYVGRHTLDIYAIQLAGSELFVGLAPGLAP